MKTNKLRNLFLGLLIVGCSNLEENPQGVLAPETFFNSTVDLQTAVNGAFGHMTHENFWGRRLSLTLMLRSDMVDIGDPTTAQRRIDHNDFNVLADNGMIDLFWPRTYQIIAAANQAIAGADLVEADEAEENAIIAQAYFARAFAYFHLVRLFGDIPYIDEPITDIVSAGTISRTPASEVYENIIADLEFAEMWLPDTQLARSIPAKSAAQSYLALVYLTLEDYQMAYDNAMEVINNESAYNLALEANFQNLFDATVIDNSQEPIFVLDFEAFRNGDDGQDFAPALTGIRSDEQYGIGGGWSVAVPSLAVFDDWDDLDYRKSVSFDATGVFNGNVEPFTIFRDFNTRAVNRPHIAKYTRGTGATANGNGRASQHNYSMIRYAEVLLIAAEALNELNPGSAEAMGYVNRIRERARNGNGSAIPADIAGLSQAELRDAILEERRLEFAFEFKRWYDIARRRMSSDVFNESGFEGAKPSFMEARDYLLPIPADELSRNSNLTQNPGY